MKNFKIVTGIVAGIISFILTVSYVCFRIVFFVSKKQKKAVKENLVPEGKLYEPYHEDMLRWIKETRELPHEEFTITSFDGLKLYGKYFECDKNAPIELMFHGYRGSAERDLSGGVQRCFKLGRNVLVVDQRTSCNSEGNVISFGVNESKDCLAWISFMIEHFGSDVQIIMTGISMGAATVLMAAGKQLPPNVIGVLADCGYSAAKEIIKKCARQMHLPANIIYPFIKLGAKIYGHFDLEEYSPIEAMKTCKIPVIFVHGEADDFVPCEMSKMTYDVCKSPKRMFTVPDAGHGLVYLVDNPGYLREVSEFFTENGIPTKIKEYG